MLFKGRCVVLEIPQSKSQNRYHSHVLYTQGNEIFMHGLIFPPKPNLEEQIFSHFALNQATTQKRDYRINVNFNK